MPNASEAAFTGVKAASDDIYSLAKMRFWICGTSRIQRYSFSRQMLAGGKTLL